MDQRSTSWARYGVLNMRYVNWLFVVLAWMLTAVDVWCWCLAATLPFAAATKSLAEALGHYQIMTVYASLVLVVIVLISARHASRRVRWLGILGCVANLLVFGASVLHLLLALSGAHIT
jgi:hypothetical protein